jgi:hypothetical protein
MSKAKFTLSIAILSLAAACSSSPPPEAASATMAPEAPAAPAAESATKPDVAAAKKHFADHVKYPATRDEVLAACAQTPEFSAGEKRWLSDNLPDKSYASADEVAAALKL